ncbi:MAG: hypothetical protein ACOH2M_27775 [Cypionkella sp.]
MPEAAHLPHNGGMNKIKAIQKFKRAADTGFDVLGPAKTVARSMGHIKRLRSKHGLGWGEIGELFNAAMHDLGSATASATTLCRLYHLERKRIARRQRKSGIAMEASNRDAAAPVPNAPSTSAMQAPKSPPPGHHAAPRSRARDGPLPESLEAPGSLDTGALPSTREILDQARDIAAFKNQAKRKT